MKPLKYGESILTFQIRRKHFFCDRIYTLYLLP